MRNIIDILTEKLHLTKSANLRKNLLYGDIDEVAEKCPSWAKRKYVRGSTIGQNKKWYAIYLYLYYEGPKTRKEVCKVLKDDIGLDIGGVVFQQMKENNLIRGEKQANSKEEIIHTVPVTDWQRQTKGWRYELG